MPPTARRYIEVHLSADKALGRLKGLEASAKKTEKSVGLLQRQFGALGNQLRGFAGYLGIRELAQFSDTAQNVAARLRSVTDTVADSKDAFDDLLAIGNKLGIGINELASSYTKLAQAVPEASHKQLVQGLETVSNVLAKTGAGVQATNAVLLQFSQGLGSAAIQGDEFRAIAENAPVLLRAWREALGLTEIGFKDLSKGAYLTKESFFELLPEIQRISKEMVGLEPVPLTIARALTTLSNSFIALLQDVNPISVAFNGLAQVIVLVAGNLDTLVIASLALLIPLGKMLPAINLVVLALINARTAVLALIAAWKKFGPVLVAAVFYEIGKAIGEAYDKMNKFKGIMEDVSQITERSGSIIEGLWKVEDPAVLERTIKSQQELIDKQKERVKHYEGLRDAAKGTGEEFERLTRVVALENKELIRLEAVLISAEKALEQLKIQGKVTVDELNTGLSGIKFNPGKLIEWQGTDPDLQRQIASFAAAAQAAIGSGITITAGYARSGTGHSKGSQHYYRNAVDIVAEDWAALTTFYQANAYKWPKLIFPVANERPGDPLTGGSGAHWHAQLEKTGKVAEKVAPKVAKVTKEQKLHNKAQEEGARLMESLRTPEEEHIARVEKATALHEAGHITLETLNREIDNSAAALNDVEPAAKKAGTELSTLEQAAKDAASAFEDSLGNAIVAVFTDGLSGAADAMQQFGNWILNYIAKLAAQMLTQQIIVPIVGAVAGTVGLGGAAGGAGGAGGIGSITGGGGGGGGTGGLGNIAKIFTGSSNSTASWAGGIGQKYLGLSSAGAGNLSSSAWASNAALGVGGALGGIGGGLLAGALYGGKGYSQIGGSLGGAGGAQVGMMIGTAIMPGIGTVIGGILGAAIGGAAGGGLGSLFGGSAKKSPQATLDIKGGQFKIVDYRNLGEAGPELQKSVDTLNSTLDQLEAVMGPEAAEARAGFNRDNAQPLSPDQFEGWLQASFEGIVDRMAGSLGDIARDAWKKSGGDLNAFATSMEVMGAAIKHITTIVAADPLDTYVKALERSQIGIEGTMTALVDEIERLGEPKTLDQLVQLTEKVEQRYQLELQMLDMVAAAIKQVQLNAEAARETILLTNASDSQKYAHFQGQANMYLEQLEKATDPEEIARLSQLAMDALMKAWSLLPPELQEANKIDFLGLIDYIEAITTEQLGNAVERSQKEFEAMQDQLAAIGYGNTQREEVLNETRDTNRKLDDLIREVRASGNYGA